MEIGPSNRRNAEDHARLVAHKRAITGGAVPAELPSLPGRTPMKINEEIDAKGMVPEKCRFCIFPTS